MDQEWLDCVMAETNGYHYSVFLEGELVAVLGIKFPDSKHPDFHLTDITVKPDLRNKGIGSQVLDELLKRHLLKPGQSWKTVVNINNPKAKSFFEKNGWVCVSKRPDKNSMITLIYPAQLNK